VVAISEDRKRVDYCLAALDPLGHVVDSAFVRSFYEDYWGKERAADQCRNLIARMPIVGPVRYH